MNSSSASLPTPPPGGSTSPVPGAIVPTRVRAVLTGHPGHAQLAEHVISVFREQHNARIGHLHPVLLGLHGADDRIIGAIGTTPGSSGPLFLEAYLDNRIDQQLAQALSRPIDRRRLAEVGNLAGERCGSSLILVSCLTETLFAAGFEHAVFTATAAIRRCFSRVGAELVDLGSADGSRLGPSLADWGDYYDRDPRVVAIDLYDLRETLRSQPTLCSRLDAAWRLSRAEGMRLAAMGLAR